MKRLSPAGWWLLCFLLGASASCGRAQNAGSAGAFVRMGSGARGMGLGNAGTALNSGEITTYYNPSLGAFATGRSASVSMGILAFDRYLNFLSYTQPIHPTAGISIGLINAGVRHIDGRDDDGTHTEDYSTSENQFFLAFSNRVDPAVSLGVAIKLYYSKLFTGIASTTVGFDLGATIQASEAISIGIAVQDLNSKYKWDSKPLYGPQAGTSGEEDKFPNLRRIGLAWKLPSKTGVVTAEYENSSLGTGLFRAGIEAVLTDNFSIRGGADRIDFSDAATGVRPSFGFTVKSSFSGWSPALHYAFVAEPFSSHGVHLITLSSVF